MMYSCGMESESGAFAFQVGFPAAAAISGAMIIVIPGLCGFATYSPRLNNSGNSVRGVRFAQLLGQQFNFHAFRGLEAGDDGHIANAVTSRLKGVSSPTSLMEDPVSTAALVREGSLDETSLNSNDGDAAEDQWDSKAVCRAELEMSQCMDMLWACRQGDIVRARQLLCAGADINFGDYDARTPLHCAASEARYDTVEFLLLKGADPHIKDRFGNSPRDDVLRVLKEEPDNAEAQKILNMLDEARWPMDPPSGGTLVDRVRYYLGCKGSASLQELKSALLSAGLEKVSPQQQELMAQILHLSSTGGATKADIEKALLAVGLNKVPTNQQHILDKITQEGPLSDKDLEMVVNDRLLCRAIKGELKIQSWKLLTEEFDRIFDECAGNDGGHVATYIPTLAVVDPNLYAAAICSVDGQTRSRGDVDKKFCVQSCCKPINYAIAIELRGRDKVEQHVGCEPSGKRFNAMVLNELGAVPIPHNPLVNAGAIMSCALIEGPDYETRVKTVMEFWKQLSGLDECTYDKETAVAESRTGDRNKCLAYMMKEAGSFPDNVDIMDTLEFYFSACAIEQTVESLSVVAATLANGGVNPVTNERIFKSETVRDVLSLMYSCGMYDYSGEFAFKMGFPAKSGVAGALLVVFPNVMGMCTWSPPLDGNGNSVRGIDFCERFARKFRVHTFEISEETEKRDLLNYYGSMHLELSQKMIIASSKDDVVGLSHFINLGGEGIINMADYDGRTPLHLAAVDGRIRTLKFFLKFQCLELNPVDRWGKTPLDEAHENSHLEFARLLMEEADRRTRQPKRKSSSEARRRGSFNLSNW